MLILFAALVLIVAVIEIIYFRRLRESAEIHNAIERGDIGRVKALLGEKPALAFSTYDGMMPLHWAAVSGRKDLVGLLLANKADVNGKSNRDATPLHVAAQNGHKDVAELLLAHGAEVNSKANDGYTALHVAARHGQRDVVELLLSKGADVNAKNGGGHTPLDEAVDNNYQDVVELLVTKFDANDLAKLVTDAKSMPTRCAALGALADQHRLAYCYAAWRQGVN